MTIKTTKHTAANTKPSYLWLMRAHEHDDWVLDSLAAMSYYLDGSRSRIAVAVDQNVTLSDSVRRAGYACYQSPARHRWGAGLWGLWLESVADLEARGLTADRWVSVDYDTLLIGPGIEEEIDRLVKPGVGMLGGLRKKAKRWARAAVEEREKLERAWGLSIARHEPGDSILGAMMVFTSEMMQVLHRGGFLTDKKKMRATGYTYITDDVLLSILCQASGLELVNIPHIKCYWNLPCDPRGLENKGCLAFHPTKVRRGTAPQLEQEIRQYFAALRRG